MVLIGPFRKAVLLSPLHSYTHGDIRLRMRLGTLSLFQVDDPVYRPARDNRKAYQNSIQEATDHSRKVTHVAKCANYSRALGRMGFRKIQLGGKGTRVEL